GPNGERIDAVLGIRGEPTLPAAAREGKVWASISRHAEDAGFENDFISVAVLTRKHLEGHPWILAGGGAIELHGAIAAPVASGIGIRACSIGRVAHTGRVSPVVAPISALIRCSIPEPAPFVEGDRIRDWLLLPTTAVVFPYA